MLLGAAMIVRNEERCLARCLSSIRGIVDEIVVVDTGSTDGSVAIAESFGAHVIHREWDGDFAGARNVGLDHLESELVLYIDADEYLVGASRPDLERELSSRAEHVAYRLRLRHRPGFTPYWEYRMWVSRADLRFQGVIHESIVPAITSVSRTEGLRIGRVGLLLEHDGYEANQDAKHERNLPLLMEQIGNDPTRTYLWDHVGRIHAELGDREQARAAFERGIALVRANGVGDLADSQIYADQIFSNATSAAPDAELVNEAVGLFPDDALVRWACALDSLARRSYEEVDDHIEKLLAISEEAMAEQALGINMRIQAEWAYHVRGMARFARGDYDRAASDFRRAETAAPEVLAYQVKRKLAEAKAPRTR
jgi:tetratricopeptide (TPR) repeat protein